MLKAHRPRNLPSPAGGGSPPKAAGWGGIAEMSVSQRKMRFCDEPLHRHARLHVGHPRLCGILFGKDVDGRNIGERSDAVVTCPAVTFSAPSFRDGPKDRTRNPARRTVLASGFRVRSLRSRPGMTQQGRTGHDERKRTYRSSPSSSALICRARYREKIRHCARLPAVNQRPGCAVRRHMLRSSPPSSKPHTGPIASAMSPPR